jgi:hypothetical protein
VSLDVLEGLLSALVDVQVHEEASENVSFGGPVNEVGVKMSALVWMTVASLLHYPRTLCPTTSRIIQRMVLQMRSE